MSTHAIEVTAVVGTVLVQDAGRPGLAHLGVPPSGAADVGSRAAAVTLVGGSGRDAVLEIDGALTLRAGSALVVAVTGARGAVTLDGEPVEPVEQAHGGVGGVDQIGGALHVPAGATLAIAAPTWGRRTYLAVRGGLDVSPVLGSRSTDVLSGLGPAPLRTGDVLAVGEPGGAGGAGEPGEPLLRVRAVPGPVRSPGLAPLTMLDATPGPRADRLADPDALYATAWRVSHLGDRVGVRLEGRELLRARSDELPSEGVVTGSVQLPPSGQPVILGPDHPVTGGYPVVAVLTARACDAAAQLRPGGTVRFRRAGT